MSFNPVFEYLVAYMVFVGFLQGLVESLFFLVNLEIAGKNRYRTACGFTLALTSVSMTTGPPLAGKQITSRFPPCCFQITRSKLQEGHRLIIFYASIMKSDTTGLSCSK